jgi:hypothetical protein
VTNPPKPAPHPAAVIGLAVGTLAALAGTVTGVWLADWRWAATGVICAVVSVLLGVCVVALVSRG